MSAVRAFHGLFLCLFRLDFSDGILNYVTPVSKPVLIKNRFCLVQVFQRFVKVTLIFVDQTDVAQLVRFSLTIAYLPVYLQRLLIMFQRCLKIALSHIDQTDVAQITSFTLTITYLPIYLQRLPMILQRCLKITFIRVNQTNVAQSTRFPLTIAYLSMYLQRLL